MNQTKMFQADMFGGSAIAATAAPTRPQAPAQQSTMFDDLLTGAAADLVGKGQIPPAYRSILALAELDSNRQALAVEALGTGRISTPGAFRAYCAQLGKAQADEASEKTAGALLLGAAPESAILPDAAEVASVPALDGENEATTAPRRPNAPRGTAARYIPDGAEMHAHPDGLGVVYVTRQTGRIVGLAYGGQRAKADWHFRFASESRLAQKIAEYFAGLSAHAARMRDAATTRQVPHDLPVGTIIYNSWGYDQTNIDFYQVVKTSACYVWLRAIAATSSEEIGFMSAYKAPRPDHFLTNSPIEQHRVTTFEGRARISFEYGSGWVYEGKPMLYSWYA